MFSQSAFFRACLDLGVRDWLAAKKHQNLKRQIAELLGSCRPPSLPLVPSSLVVHFLIVERPAFTHLFTFAARMKYASCWVQYWNGWEVQSQYSVLLLGSLSFKCLSEAVDALIPVFGIISCWQKLGLFATTTVAWASPLQSGWHVLSKGWVVVGHASNGSSQILPCVSVSNLACVCQALRFSVSSWCCLWCAKLIDTTTGPGQQVLWKWKTGISYTPSRDSQGVCVCSRNKSYWKWMKMHCWTETAKYLTQLLAALTDLMNRQHNKWACLPS